MKFTTHVNIPSSFGNSKEKNQDKNLANKIPENDEINEDQKNFFATLFPTCPVCIQ